MQLVKAWVVVLGVTALGMGSLILRDDGQGGRCRATGALPQPGVNPGGGRIGP